MTTAIQIKAINTNNGINETIDGFTVYPQPQNLFSTRDKLKREIQGEGYKGWSGERRRDFIQKMKDRGYAIKIAIVAGQDEDC